MSHIRVFMHVSLYVCQYMCAHMFIPTYIHATYTHTICFLECIISDLLYTLFPTEDGFADNMLKYTHCNVYSCRKLMHLVILTD